MYFTKKLGYLLLTVASLFTSCSKEGPQGPAGPQGEQGPKGDTGAQGAKGDMGTANVIYSDWAGIRVADWSGLGTSLVLGDIAAPKLTKDNINNVTVMVYLKTTEYAVALPFTIANRINLFGFKAGNIRIQISAISGTISAAEARANIYRYVIIPGGIHARSSSPYPDLKNYHAVCEYYGIPE